MFFIGPFKISVKFPIMSCFLDSSNREQIPDKNTNKNQFHKNNIRYCPKEYILYLFSLLCVG